MNCRNSDLPDTAMAPSCGCGRSLSDISGPGPVVRPVANFCFDDNDPRFPIGMGYVPMQMWGTIYPLARGFVRGTIFPSLDLPFAVGGAEDEGTISMQHDAGNAGRTCE